jgi:hypothetical protein
VGSTDRGRDQNQGIECSQVRGGESFERCCEIVDTQKDCVKPLLGLLPDEGFFMDDLQIIPNLLNSHPPFPWPKVLVG